MYVIKSVLLLTLLVGFNSITTIKLNPFSQNKYTVTFNYGVIKHQDSEYIYDLELKNVMVNKTKKAFSVIYCVKQKLDGPSFKLNIKALTLSYNIPRDVLFQFDVKVCEMLNNNFFGAKNTLKSGNGTTCPIEKGCYKQDNFVLDEKKFPPFIPPNVYRLDLSYFYYKKVIVEAQITIEVKYGL